MDSHCYVIVTLRGGEEFYYVDKTLPEARTLPMEQRFSSAISDAQLYDDLEMAEQDAGKINQAGVAVHVLVSHICPRCKRRYSGYPAISRADNKTPICSDCGTAEALEVFAKSSQKGLVKCGK